MGRLIGAWLIALAGLGAAGCADHRLPGRDEVPASSQLVDAAYPECAQLGEVVLEYLKGGDAGPYPELDQRFAQVRADILSEPEAARDGLARAQASDAVVQCDAQRQLETEQAAEAASEEEARLEAEREEQQRAEAMADEERREAEREAASQRAFVDACQGRGGYVSDSSSTCLVDYDGWPAQVVPLHPDGTFDTETAAINEEDCGISAEDAEISAEDGYPWSRLPEYDATTGVCVPGSP